jgi:hypothetical protein
MTIKSFYITHQVEWRGRKIEKKIKGEEEGEGVGEGKEHERKWWREKRGGRENGGA